MKMLVPVAGMLIMVSVVQAGELPKDIQAKFIKILAQSAGSPGRVVCHDPDMQAALTKVGVNSDGAAKVAWASSLTEVRSMKTMGKLVICGKQEWLTQGAAIALVEEGGKPQVILHMGHIAASGVSLSEAVLKIGKRE